MKLFKKLKALFWKKLSQVVISRGWDRIAEKKGWFKPKVVVRVDGGLASQMSFFALGYVAAKKSNLPLYFDTTWFDTCGRDVHGRKNRYFNLFKAFPRINELYKDRLVNEKTVSTLFRKIFSDQYSNRDMMEFNPDKFPNHSLYIETYYPNINYILPCIDELRELMVFRDELTPEEQELMKQIRSTTSCALHIRRGDYCGTVHEVCTEQYYINALTRMQELHPDTVFFVFTNDEEWSENFLKKNLPPEKFVLLKNRTEETPIADMHLMWACKHAIVSNSGFSLFPAFLSASEHKTTIAPEIFGKGKMAIKTAGKFNLPHWILLPVE